MNSNIKQYLKEVSEKLSCPKGVKSVFLRQLKSEILAFAETNTTITVEELYKEFGSPEEISAGFFDRDDYDAMLKKAKKRVIFWMCVSVVAIILLVVSVYIIVAMLNVLGGTFEVTDAGMRQ